MCSRILASWEVRYVVHAYTRNCIHWFVHFIRIRKKKILYIKFKFWLKKGCVVCISVAKVVLTRNSTCIYTIDFFFSCVLCNFMREKDDLNGVRGADGVWLTKWKQYVLYLRFCACVVKNVTKKPKKKRNTILQKNTHFIFALKLSHLKICIIFSCAESKCALNQIVLGVYSAFVIGLWKTKKSICFRKTFL